jgi:hypothetical protein
VTDDTINELTRADMEKPSAEPIPTAKQPEVRSAPSSRWMDDFSPWLEDSEKATGDRERNEKPERGLRSGREVREMIAKIKAGVKGTARA